MNRNLCQMLSSYQMLDAATENELLSTFHYIYYVPFAPIFWAHHHMWYFIASVQQFGYTCNFTLHNIQQYDTCIETAGHLHRNSSREQVQNVCTWYACCYCLCHKVAHYSPRTRPVGTVETLGWTSLLTRHLSVGCSTWTHSELRYPSLWLLETNIIFLVIVIPL